MPRRLRDACRPDRYVAVGGFSPMIDKYVTRKAAIRCANRALKEMRCRELSTDFCNGFRCAYVDVACGGNGAVPPVPPQCYWQASRRHSEGHMKADQWFAGYEAGAQSALSHPESAFRQEVASSGVASLSPDNRSNAASAPIAEGYPGGVYPGAPYQAYPPAEQDDPSEVYGYGQPLEPIPSPAPYGHGPQPNPVPTEPTPAPTHAQPLSPQTIAPRADGPAIQPVQPTNPPAEAPIPPAEATRVPENADSNSPVTYVDPFAHPLFPRPAHNSHSDFTPRPVQPQPSMADRSASSVPKGAATDPNQYFRPTAGIQSPVAGEQSGIQPDARWQPNWQPNVRPNWQHNWQPQPDRFYGSGQ